MATIPHVLHTGARPVSAHEFIEALRATCKPRFPHARQGQHRQVALAVSGGVDSMAMVSLCRQARRVNPFLRISDHETSNFVAFVVDHGLRSGSDEEALAVKAAVKDMGISCEILPINLSKVYGDDVNPAERSNLETIARRLRFRRLGKALTGRGIGSLLLAHHEDDQYETVLMRMMSGHGVRGLRGMRRAGDIPECEGLHAISQSGFVDDQLRRVPFYNPYPSKRERKALKAELAADVHRSLALALEDRQTDSFDDSSAETEERRRHPISLDLDPVDIEDGGIWVYRPLLEFSKDRLIATCLANNVPWWEDHTNHDPTLTMRNAIRRMYKGFELPQALQKPAVLALSRRCENKARAQEEEADRLLGRAMIHEFEHHVGTAIVQLPEVKRDHLKRYTRTQQRRDHRLHHQRTVAGILIQRILALVTPDSNLPPLANLETVISKLFPRLGDDPEQPPKAFTIGGVHLVPIESVPPSATAAVSPRPLTWYVTRALPAKSQPLPQWSIPFWARQRLTTRHTHSEGSASWSRWAYWQLYDGRFWIQISHRLPYPAVVLPYMQEHAKPFRDKQDPASRERINAILKRYAPGKVRFTLPAIYLEKQVDLDKVDPQGDHPRSRGAPGYYKSAHIKDHSNLMLLALPTLGIQLPGLDNWIRYGIRYRKVDTDTLKTAGTYDRGCFVSPKSRQGPMTRVRGAKRKAGGVRRSRRRNVRTYSFTK